LVLPSQAVSHRIGAVALAVEEDVALGPVDVRLLGAAGVVAGLDGVADAVEEAGLRRLRRDALLAHARDAAAAGSVEWCPKSLPPGWPWLVSWRATYRIGSRPRNSPKRIYRTASWVEGPNLWSAATGAGNRRPSWLTSDHYFETELERLVCRQVIAGPRNQVKRRVSDHVANPFVFSAPILLPWFRARTSTAPILLPRGGRPTM
jgi:hypothetical protein